MTGIFYYAEPLCHGRGIMRVDVVENDALVLTYTDGSPAPFETVKRHERRLVFSK